MTPPARASDLTTPAHQDDEGPSLEVTAAVDSAGSRPTLLLTLSGSLAYGATDPLIGLVEHHLIELDELGRIQLNGSEVEFCDSHGIAQLLRIKAMAATCGADLLIVDPSPSMRRVLRMTGVLELLNTSPPASAIRRAGNA